MHTVTAPHTGAGGRYQEIDVALIDLDASNPRIAAFLEIQEPPYTPEMIFLALGAGGSDEESATGSTFSKLKQSILTNGSIVQPVILHAKEGGRYTCIEGNTRVALYNDFLSQNLPGQWSRIPAIVHESLDGQEVHAIRLQAHLVGPRPWDPYSKAKYLTHLRTVENFPFNRLVDFCGGSQRAVVEALDAYADMERHYRPQLTSDEDFDVSRFSGFVELQKGGVKEAVVRAGFTLDEFGSWIAERKIEKLAHVRWLPKILRDKRATETFLKEGSDEAVRTVDAPDTNKALQDATLVSLCRALNQAIGRIEYKEVRRMKEDPTSPTAQYLLETFESLQEIVTDIRST
jgi:hypothetical protein